MNTFVSIRYVTVSVKLLPPPQETVVDLGSKCLHCRSRDSISTNDCAL